MVMMGLAVQQETNKSARMEHGMLALQHKFDPNGKNIDSARRPN